MYDQFKPRAESRQLSCSGSLIEPTGLAPSPKNLRLVLGPKTNCPSISDRAALMLAVLSNNRIQLKFSTKEFTGEFFHYTGDLFLIYKSGHLARLTCTPA